VCAERLQAAADGEELYPARDWLLPIASLARVAFCHPFFDGRLDPRLHIRLDIQDLSFGVASFGGVREFFDHQFVFRFGGIEIAISVMQIVAAL